MNFRKLFVTRESALYYDITAYQEGCKSWIGGNAPKFFDTGDFFESEDYYFYLTLQSPINPDKQFSIFTPDFDTALEGNSYPGCKVILIEHTACVQSKNNRFRHPEIEDIYSIHEIGEDKDCPEKNNVIKFGGKAIPIQWGLDNDGKVTGDGFDYIFQVNEIGMGDIAAFMSGCVYVYGKVKENNITNLFVAYWEYS
ncbi:MAG: hypothetical protein LBV72_09835 [Tannerella sp.]|jgi:hypothetical protein|nr:hypothetical protein [Tannerella sp.]